MSREEKIAESLIAAGQVFDMATVDDWVNKLQSGIKAPTVGVKYSTLGGEKDVSILIMVSMDDKKDWINNILENSHYVRLHLYNDGVLDMISGHVKPAKNFRKTRVMSVEDAIVKINRYVVEVDRARAEVKTGRTGMRNEVVAAGEVSENLREFIGDVYAALRRKDRNDPDWHAVAPYSWQIAKYGGTFQISYDGYKIATVNETGDVFFARFEGKGGLQRKYPIGSVAEFVKKLREFEKEYSEKTAGRTGMRNEVVAAELVKVAKSLMAVPMTFDAPSTETTRWAKKTLMITLNVDASWKQIYASLLTVQEGTSNKFHYFGIFKSRDGQCVGGNAYGRIGYNPKAIEIARGISPAPVMNAVLQKVSQKRAKGYQVTEV